MHGPSAGDISDALAERIEQLAGDLIREPPQRDTANTIRFQGQGGLIVTIRGQWRGRFSCWAADQHGDALDLIAYTRRCTLAEARRWALDWLGGNVPSDPSPPKVEQVAPPAADAGTATLARKLWTEATSAVTAPIVVAYLRGRGLTVPPNAPLRYHGACPRSAERLPAMLALMTDPASGEPRGIHRTFLTPDGNKASGQSKAMLGGAGVIRLVPDDEVVLGLGLAEGVETSLAVMEHADWRPVWAAGSAGGIGKFPVLPGIEALTIFADCDDAGAGVAAAHECSERWRAAGRECRIVLPPPGMDFNDTVRRAA